jgi:hypothetical protein
VGPDAGPAAAIYSGSSASIDCAALKVSLLAPVAVGSCSRARESKGMTGRCQKVVAMLSLGQSLAK